MSSTFSNLKFELIGNGEQSGTWGTTTNTNIGTAIEQAIVGMATLDSGDFSTNVCTLTLSNTNAAQDARALCLNIASGAVSAAGTVNVPAIEKPYIIINGSSFTVTVKVSGQTGVAVPAGKRTVVYNNGTDVGSQINWLAALDAATATLSGNLTLSGGTANGVAYLNGSKVLTTGSALTFDGSDVLQLTATNNAVVNLIGSITNNAVFRLQNATTGNLAGIYANNSKQLIFEANGTAEQMRLTSTGLGIGTSSPTQKLDVQGGNIAVGTTTAGNSTASMVFGKVAAGGGTINNRITLATYGGLYGAYMEAYADLSASTATYLAFGTTAGGGGSPTERMRLDSSGNLGLGVTPSAWSGYKAIQIGNAAAVAGFSGNFAWLGCNWFNNGSGNKYINTGFATLYEQSSGQHIWNTAPSGTAGNAITFTQAMTLDASGNLSLGMTSPLSAASGRVDLTVNGSSTSILSLGVGTIRQGYVFAANPGIILSSENGTLGLLTSTAQPITFSTNNAERARIDSSGNLLVGTTTANAKLYVNSASGTSSNNIRSDMTGNSLTAINISSIALGTSNNNNNFKHFGAFTADTGTYVFYVYGQGNVVNANNSYGAISDVKLKENIVDATPKLAGLMQVKVRNYNLKTDPGQKQLGVIAQELEQVFPGMVEESPDRDKDGNDLGTTTKQVKYSVFVPMLIKALQEQTEIINALTARVAALESN